MNIKNNNSRKRNASITKSCLRDMNISQSDLLKILFRLSERLGNSYSYDKCMELPLIYSVAPSHLLKEIGMTSDISMDELDIPLQKIVDAFKGSGCTMLPELLCDIPIFTAHQSGILVYIIFLFEVEK